MSQDFDEQQAMELHLKADGRKLMSIVEEYAKAQKWQRESSYYQTRQTYLFNYRREKLIIGESNNTIGFQCKPQAPTMALTKIADVFKYFYRENPTSPLKLTVTLLNLNAEKTKEALSSMLNAGVDIDKIKKIKNGSGKILPDNELQAFIKEVKAPQITQRSLSNKP